MGSNPEDMRYLAALRGPGPVDQQQLGAHDPEPLNLRQREVIALEAIAKTLENLVIEFVWLAQYVEPRK